MLIRERHWRTCQTLGLVLLAVCLGPTTANAEGAGSLVIVGGGGTPDSVIRKAIELAGGNEASIVIFPDASIAKNRGSGSAEMFRAAGAKNVSVAVSSDHDAAAAMIQRSDLIWFPGGQQDRLVTSLAEAGLVDLIRRRHSEGGIVGGTSAGAAAMSQVMIPRSPSKSSLTSGNTPIANGLGLIPELIIDQHFVQRGRINRLLGTVIDHPKLVGVGIGERTAIITTGQRWTVWGEGSVVVIDARRATIGATEPGQLQSSHGVRLDVLIPGDHFSLSDEVGR